MQSLLQILTHPKLRDSSTEYSVLQWRFYYRSVVSAVLGTRCAAKNAGAGKKNAKRTYIRARKKNEIDWEKKILKRATSIYNT